MSFLFRRNLRSEKASDLLCHRTADLTRCSNTPPVRRSSRTSHVRGSGGTARAGRGAPAPAGRASRPAQGEPPHGSRSISDATAASTVRSQELPRATLQRKGKEPGPLAPAVPKATWSRGNPDLSEEGKSGDHRPPLEAARGKRARWSLRRVRHCA